MDDIYSSSCDCLVKFILDKGCADFSRLNSDCDERVTMVGVNQFLCVEKSLEGFLRSVNTHCISQFPVLVLRANTVFVLDDEHWAIGV